MAAAAETVVIFILVFSLLADSEHRPNSVDIIAAFELVRPWAAYDLVIDKQRRPAVSSEPPHYATKGARA
jgi:hypothetical protein